MATGKRWKLLLRLNKRFSVAPATKRTVHQVQLHFLEILNNGDQLMVKVKIASIPMLLVTI